MPRPIQSFTLAFGLVNIPVRMYSAAASKRVRFHWLDARTGERVQQQLVSPGLAGRPDDAEQDELADARAARGGEPQTIQRSDEQAKTPSSHATVVPRADLRKGYEVSPQDYVQLTAEELKALELDANDHAEIQEFIPLSAIQPAFIEKSYYLGPEKGNDKVYRLLSRALYKQGYGAIAKIIMRGKEKVVCVRPMEGDRLMLEMLYYADEVRDVGEIPVRDVTLSEPEIALAEQVVSSMASEDWDASKYRDTFRERVLALIEEKRQGRPVQMQTERRKAEPVIDLMEALKRSLKQSPQHKKPKAPAMSQTAHRKRRAS